MPCHGSSLEIPQIDGERLSLATASARRATSVAHSSTRRSEKGAKQRGLRAQGSPLRLCGEEGGGDEHEDSSDENDAQCGPHFGP
jgi:hypothetical protein